MIDHITIIWTDKATYETGLDTRSCYVTCRKGTTILESRYLNHTFKSGKSTVGIWEAIVLRLKGPVHFLENEGRMKSDIYINQS